MTFLFICLAGGLGAVARYGLSGIAAGRLGSAGGTVVVNLLGSFLLGLVLGTLAGDLAAVLGIGFLGGFTTFSTAMVDATESRRKVLLLAGTALGALLALAGGLALGETLVNLA